jgi:hypothetical protein
MEVKQVVLGDYTTVETQEENTLSQTNQENNSGNAAESSESQADENANGGAGDNANADLNNSSDAEAKGQNAAEAENNSSDFTFDLDDKGQTQSQQQSETQQQQQAPAVIAWQDAIKQVDPIEVAKAAGVSEFALELDKHIKNGGSAMDYLNAKAVDYNKVSDLDLMKGEFAKKYPHLDAEEQAYLFNKKYAISELDEEDVQLDKKIALKADAYEIRQQKIAEQANFKIPEPVKQAAPAEDAQAQQQAIAELEQRRNFVFQHEATKDLLTNKRVVVDLGEGVSYKWNLGENAHKLAQPLVDDAAWQKMITNDKGELNVKLLQKLAFIAANPNYERDLVNYGKSLGKKSIVEENQNAKVPHGSPIVNSQPSQGTVVKGQTTLASYR